MTDSVNYNVELRMRQLIHVVLKGRPDWKGMEELTGAKAVKWRHFVAGVKKPSIEMLESLCTTFPQYAFWLATGISDEDAGHLAPAWLHFPGKLSGGGFPIDEQDSTASYFKACQLAATSLWRAKVIAREQFSGQATTEVDMGEDLWGLGVWMRSDAGPIAAGKESHTQLMQKLKRQQRSHLEQSLLRLRLYNRDADDIIDKQRAEEQELEKMLERPRANEESSLQKQNDKKDGN